MHKCNLLFIKEPKTLKVHNAVSQQWHDLAHFLQSCYLASPINRVFMHTLNEKDLAIETIQVKKGALIFRAINHPLRRQILELLHENVRMTVTEVFVKLRLEQSVASQHLAILRKAMMVNTERQGKFIFYSVNYQRVKQVHQIADEI